MTKIYLVLSAALLVAMLFGSMIFAQSAELASVSWNSLPTLNWTAGSPSWNGGCNC